MIASAVAKSKEYTSDDELSVICKDHELTSERIFAAAVLPIEVDDDNADEADLTKEADTRLVAVTYGEKDTVTHEKKAVKTFLLNYNDYAVVVEYGGRIYTVARGGYVVVNY